MLHHAVVVSPEAVCAAVLPVEERQDKGGVGGGRCQGAAGGTTVGAPCYSVSTRMIFIFHKPWIVLYLMHPCAGDEVPDKQ